MNGVFKKIAAVALSAGMIAASCVTSFAAPATTVGTTSTNKATIAVGKTLYNPKGKLSAQSFNFRIEAVEAADGRTMKTIAAKDIPMPTAERCRQNLSRAKLCEKTGYSSKALYNIECGKVKTSVKLFEDFAAALGYSCSIVIKKRGENSR